MSGETVRRHAPIDVVVIGAVDEFGFVDGAGPDRVVQVRVDDSHHLARGHRYDAGFAIDAIEQQRAYFGIDDADARRSDDRVPLFEALEEALQRTGRQDHVGRHNDDETAQPRLAEFGDRRAIGQRERHAVGNLVGRRKQRVDWNEDDGQGPSHAGRAASPDFVARASSKSLCSLRYGMFPAARSEAKDRVSQRSM